MYSVFSRFGVSETVNFFDSTGLKTYIQPDGRIFPQTDQAESVRQLFLKRAQQHNIRIVDSCVNQVIKNDEKFVIQTKITNYEYDAVIIATGGKSAGCDFAKKLGHTVTELRPSLTSLITREKWIKNLAGVSIQNAHIQAFFNGKKKSDIFGDFVFAHKGLSGPAVFNTSSHCAFLDYCLENPLKLKINFLHTFEKEAFRKKLELEIKDLPDKSVSNILKKHIPKSLSVELLAVNNINPDKKAYQLSEKEINIILNIVFETEIHINSPAQDGEIVTAGGVDLKEVNPSTMESKLIKNLSFCGEVLDIDGLTGGFNLQMCWSTGYLAGLNLID